MKTWTSSSSRTRRILSRTRPALLFSGDADLAEHYEMVERQGDGGLRWAGS